MKRSVPCFLFCLVVFSGTSQAQSQKPNDMLHFFLGNWSGEGSFASGKPIAADLTFKYSLDSAWILYEHTDRQPNKYKALSMWGFDKAISQYTSQVFDNFGGNRRFISPGWVGNRFELMLENKVAHAPLQRFVYEKIDGDRFKMTFEVNQDGKNWRMIDYLVFTRQ